MPSVTSPCTSTTAIFGFDGLLPTVAPVPNFFPMACGKSGWRGKGAGRGDVTIERKSAKHICEVPATREETQANEPTKHP